MLLGAGCILGIQIYNKRQNDIGWSRAPGLRRLMNDRDEGN
jgi:hypothetical protein